jgi:hypothetical protein
MIGYLLFTFNSRRCNLARRSTSDNSTANLGFETKLWGAADLLRGNIESSEYKHVVLGLIFLKYVSDAFEERRAQLLEEQKQDAGVDLEDPEEYAAKAVFYLPENARWSGLQSKAKQPNIGTLIDDAMKAIEDNNPKGEGQGLILEESGQDPGVLLPPFRPDVPTEVVRLIEKMTARRTEDRFQSCEEVLNALTRCASSD